MPRVDFTLWDRTYILKLVCITQMTFASFITILYTYLIVLQNWTSVEDTRQEITPYKWSSVVSTFLDFGTGTLLAFGANMKGRRCKRRVVYWIVIESVLVPTTIFLLMRLYYKINQAEEVLTTDLHFARTCMVHVCFLLCHYVFITYALFYLTHLKQKIKCYDPSIRPESVYEPTDPKITTTESRHIRMSQSFLFQPSTSKAPQNDVEQEKEIETMNVSRNASQTNVDQEKDTGNV